MRAHSNYKCVDRSRCKLGWQIARRKVHGVTRIDDNHVLRALTGLGAWWIAIHSLAELIIETVHRLKHGFLQTDNLWS
jgi:hypothetical protein